MTATPSRSHRLWHPTRGISFSPGSASPVPPVSQSQRTMVKGSVRVSQYHGVVSQSIGAQSDVLAEAVVQQTSFTERTQSTAPILTFQKPAESAGEAFSVQPTAKAEEPEKKATDDPPPPVFEYKILDDLFYAAKRAPPGSPESFWSYDQYRRTAEDGSLHKVTVHYCRSRHTMEKVCQKYFMDEKVLGFDLEWMADSMKRDGLKKNVSLIQLASPSRIALFHVALFTDNEDMVGPSFRSLMEDKSVTKAGVAIKADCTRLRNYLDIDSRGLMELSNLYKLVTYSKTRQYHNINRRLVPMALQVEEYLHLPLFKGQDVRSGDWTKVLDMEQVIYSASDAYAGLHLFATLEHHRKLLDPCPPTPHHAEMGLAIQLADGVKINGPDDALVVDEVAPPGGCRPVLSEKRLAAALETVSIEDGDSASSVIVSKRTKPSLISKEKPTQTTPAPKPLELPKDSRVEVAEDRAASYRSLYPETRSSFSQLRAYYLWHCYDLSPAAIAQLLRDPPLKTHTIVQYILSAIQAERFSVDHDRLRVITEFFPQSTLWARWPRVATMVAASADDG